MIPASGKKTGTRREPFVKADGKPPLASTPARPTAAAHARPALKTAVKPVSNAIKILRYLSTDGKIATTTQIARQIGLNPSTCFNILRTLTHEGIVEFDAMSKTYRVGYELGRLASNVLRQSEQIQLARPSMHKLAEKFGVSVALWRRIGLDRMVLVALENSSTGVSISLPIGQRLPLLLGASGRVAATRLGLSKSAVRQQFDLLRWARALSFDRYWADAQESLKTGWARDDGYFTVSTLTVAAPVLDRDGALAFTLVALMFRHQYSDQTIEEIGDGLCELSRQISPMIY